MQKTSTEIKKTTQLSSEFCSFISYIDSTQFKLILVCSVRNSSGATTVQEAVQCICWRGDSFTVECLDLLVTNQSTLNGRSNLWIFQLDARSIRSCYMLRCSGQQPGLTSIFLSSVGVWAYVGKCQDFCLLRAETTTCNRLDVSEG